MPNSSNTHPGKSSWLYWVQIALNRHGITGELHGQILRELMELSKHVKWKYQDDQMIVEEFKVMDQEQERHLAGIIEEFKLAAGAKYRKGQAEHQGNLWDVPPILLLDFAIEEAIDQVMYLMSIREQLHKLTAADLLNIGGPTAPNRT
jgi:hypothetical protein